MKRHEQRLWYDRPAQDWNQALPVGNGKLGGMIFGNPLNERIALNEDSVWSGGYLDRNNDDCLESLDTIRDLIRQGDLAQAERLAQYTMTGTPDGERVYQTMGDLFISHFGIAGEVEKYQRELNLTQAVCNTTYEVQGVEYHREVFASAPDNVLVVRLKALRGKLNFSVKISRRRFMNGSWQEDDAILAYSGGSGIEFCCMVNAQAVGGTVQARGEYLVVENASEAVLYLTAATTYRCEDPRAQCLQTLRAAATKGYDAIWADHLRDYQALYARSELMIDAPDATGIPTDRRLLEFAENRNDQSLLALYYNYGRYLLISCSRPGSLPANLQGIWCDQMSPPWDSKYTININTQMNYWPAEVCNLAPCHLPLFDHLERMVEKGRETARIMYGAKGWVAHHNTDIWGDTAPQDTYGPATFWVLGAAWLCTHIWEHYAYRPDKEFLARFYPLIREACEFFLEYMVEDAKGRLVITPTVSPENTYELPDGTKGRLCEGCAMDSQIIRELFIICQDAASVLGKDKSFVKTLGTALTKIPPTQVGSDGRIMEWLEEYGEPEPGHRHISHLYALFPGHQISVESTPELAQAAKRTLTHRLQHGGGHTGWSRAWIINFWAALGEGEAVQENLDQLLCKSTLPNLFDNHPPFQIDGNFGGIAGMANALVRSEGQEVVLLPALPVNWGSGEARGLCAKNGLTLDIRWRDGALESVALASYDDYHGVVYYNGHSVEAHCPAGGSIVLSLQDIVTRD